MSSIASLVWEIHVQAQMVHLRQYYRCKDVQLAFVQPIEQLKKAIEKNDWDACLEFLVVSLDEMIMKQHPELAVSWRRSPLQFYFFKRLSSSQAMYPAVRRSFIEVDHASEDLEIFFCLLSIRTMVADEGQLVGEEALWFKTIQKALFFQEQAPTECAGWTNTTVLIWVLGGALLVAMTHVLIAMFCIHHDLAGWVAHW